MMALSDVTTENYETFYWYKNAYENMSDYSTATSGDFGKGKDNTKKMIDKWNGMNGETSYGTQDPRDMWGNIATEVSKGWFVPSGAEWSAFAGELGISSSNYLNYGLNEINWGSNQIDSEQACITRFEMDWKYYCVVNSYVSVRLSTTF